MEKKLKLAQFLWTGLSGTKLTTEEKDFLKETPVGGVILFTRNVESPEQVFNLNKELQDIATSNGLKTPFIIGIDMEGGRVARLKEPFTVWPPMAKVSEHGSASKAFDLAFAMGKELRSVGINFNFSPCTDTILNNENEVIGDRSFSSDPDEVGKYASAIIRGFKKTNILTCIKHFPGHGYSSVDSHESLPVDNRALNEIQDIEAFKKALRSKPEFLMPGHLMLPKVDPDYPVTLSEVWIKKMLLEDMRTRAFLISDDLEMGALQKYDFDFMVERVYNLGFHQLLFCHGHEKAKEALEILASTCELDTTRLNQLLDFKENQPLLGPPSFDKSIIESEEHKELAKSF